MSGVLLDPTSIAERHAEGAAAREAARRANLDAIAHGLRRWRESYCFAPSPEFLAQAVVLSVRNDLLYADLAARAARKRSPEPSTARDPSVAPRPPRPGGKRRRGRRRR